MTGRCCCRRTALVLGVVAVWASLAADAMGQGSAASIELRSALVEAYRAAGRAAPRWTDASPSAGTSPIRAAHVTELRAAVLALE